MSTERPPTICPDQDPDNKPWIPGRACATRPWKNPVSNRLMMNAWVVAYEPTTIYFHVRLRQHKRLWKDVTLEHEDGVEVLSKGEYKVWDLSCPGPDGKNKFYSSLTLQKSEFGQGQEFKSKHIELTF
jgi:hypothetical protein